MCGRFSIFTPEENVLQRFEVERGDEPWKPRYNAAPTQRLPVITDSEPKKISILRWGLIPHWAKDESIGNKLINARSETVADKPAFRQAFAQRRCLVIADGFYEWKKSGTEKVPYRIELKDKGLFAFAGLWESWNHDGKETRTFTIITTEPNTLMEPVHNRMPAMLRQKDERRWLDQSTRADELKGMLGPYATDEMRAYQIMTSVNNPKNDTKEVLEPVTTLRGRWA